MDFGTRKKEEEKSYMVDLCVRAKFIEEGRRRSEVSKGRLCLHEVILNVPKAMTLQAAALHTWSRSPPCQYLTTTQPDSWITVDVPAKAPSLVSAKSEVQAFTLHHFLTFMFFPFAFHEDL